MHRSLAIALVKAVSTLLPLEEESFYGPAYKMDIAKDKFIHFTTRERADQIVKSGKLLMNPPYKKFGSDAVNAVSLVWGSFVPGVQTTHIKGRDLVGVIFTTRKKPERGFPEEVVWKSDVPLKNAKIVGYKEGVRLLKQANTPPDDDFYVTY